ncbi:MAG: SMC-Scp complex subunit ScpB [Chloroflexota bacterium]
MIEEGTEATEPTEPTTPAEPAAPVEADADDGALVEPGTEITALELEALLFVAEKPLSRAEIGRICRLDAEAVDNLLGDLEVALRGRGVRLVVNGERVELATAPEAGALIARYVGADTVRLTPAAMETLAIVAYRQPVTRGGIERVRGVDSDYVVRSLLHKRLIVEQGRAETPGRPILYGTSFEFMERFGLTSLEDLPSLDGDVAARLAQEAAEPEAEATDG